MDTTTIGERVRALREAQGLSRDALINRANGQISETTIRELEQGKRRAHVRTIEVVAAALGVKVEALLGDAPLPMTPALRETLAQNEPPTPWTERGA